MEAVTPSPPATFFCTAPSTVTWPAKGSRSCRRASASGELPSTSDDSPGGERLRPSPPKPPQLERETKEPPSLMRTPKPSAELTRSGRPAALTTITRWSSLLCDQIQLVSSEMGTPSSLCSPRQKSRFHSEVWPRESTPEK